MLGQDVPSRNCEPGARPNETGLGDGSETRHGSGRFLRGVQRAGKLRRAVASGAGHGRIEKRSYTILANPQGIRKVDEWAELTVIGMCHHTRIVKGKASDEVRYFIGSRQASAKTYAKVLRNHWGIENNLHWQMDVSFGEDASRITKRNGAENFALLRRLALTLLKQHPSKDSIARKQLAAALDTNVLEGILRHAGNSWCLTRIAQKSAADYH